MRYLGLGAVLATCAALLVAFGPAGGVFGQDPPPPPVDPRMEALAVRLDAQRLETERLATRLQETVGSVQELVALFHKANPEMPVEVAQAAALAVLRNSDEVFTPELLMSWLWEESRYRFRLISRAQAEGIAQIRPGTGRWIATRLLQTEWDRERVQEDPAYAIDLGVAYLRWLYDRYGGDLHRTFTAYNRGTGGLEAYIAVHGTPVSRYSSCILARVGLDDGHRCRTRSRDQEGE
ncbi:MAG: lytic transglycosylase domain-containing protein [Firmicutes bacterium]|nr:lytic transglycosylase domain-containing protein [Bacillota bacterium]